MKTRSENEKKQTNYAIEPPDFKTLAENWYSAEHYRHVSRFMRTPVEELVRQRAYNLFKAWHHREQTRRKR